MPQLKSRVGMRLAPAILSLIAACTAVTSTPQDALTRGTNPFDGEPPGAANGRRVDGYKEAKAPSGRARTTIDSVAIGDDLGTAFTSFVAERDVTAVGDAPLAMEMSGKFGMTGVPAHAVTLKAKSLSVMSDEPDSVVVTDDETGNTRTYSADQAYQSYTIQDGATKLKITVNPDGTYTVDGKPARNDSEAATLALASPVLADASIQGLSGLYVLLQNPRQATRTPMCMVNCGTQYLLAANDLWSQPTNLAYAIIKAKLKANKK